MVASHPLDEFLLEGPQRAPADMHVISGYPIWILVSVWRARGDSDADVIAEYALDPREWQAAKNYYLVHQAEIDARRRAMTSLGRRFPAPHSSKTFSPLAELRQTKQRRRERTCCASCWTKAFRAQWRGICKPAAMRSSMRLIST